jgi:molybdenum cofactor synthesis domain-containing protein
MPESPYTEMPLEAALALVLATVAPLPPVRLPLQSAEGLVLAEDLRAGEAMPPFAAAAKDGFALRAADGVAERRIVGEATAGAASSAEVAPGTAARITTGAPLPPGADAVVMLEEAHEAGGMVTPDRAVAPGADVRPAGQDYAAGELLLAAGTVLGPAELGLLAGAGATHVLAHPRAQVAVFSTGDELVEPGHALAPGQIHDSNRYSLAAAARAAGAEVIATGTLRDNPGAVGHLARAVQAADAVITSGGVSMGHLDLVKPWLAEHGRVLFGRVNVKPGKPATYAIVRGTPVFALPGFPVSTLVCFELFARPALLRLAGHRQVTRPRWSVRAGHDLAHATDRTELQRAVVTIEAGRPIARTTGMQGSGRLLSLAGANALLVLPPGSGFTAAGAAVPALILATPHAADAMRTDPAPGASSPSEAAPGHG